MSSGVKIVDKDQGWGEVMAVAQMQKTELVIHSEVPYAIFVEYGFKHYESGKIIPARPFMAWTLDEHDNYRRQLEYIGKKVFDTRKAGGKSVSYWASNTTSKEFDSRKRSHKDMSKVIREMLKTLGNLVVSHVKNTIVGMGAIRTGALHDSIVATVSAAGIGNERFRARAYSHQDIASHEGKASSHSDRTGHSPEHHANRGEHAKSDHGHLSDTHEVEHATERMHSGGGGGGGGGGSGKKKKKRPVEPVQ
jgi:hypothetical protein